MTAVIIIKSRYMERLAAGVRQIFSPDTSQGAISWMKGRGKVKGVGRVVEGGVGEGVW